MNKISTICIFLMLFVSVSFAASFYDDFESYADGSNIDGQGGWLTKNCGGEFSNSCVINTLDGKKMLNITSAGSVFAHVYRMFNLSNNSFLTARVYLPDTIPIRYFWFSMWNGSFFPSGDQGQAGDGYRTYMSSNQFGMYMPDVNNYPWSILVNTNSTEPYPPDRYYLLNLSRNGDLITLDINGTRILNYTNNTYSATSHVGFGSIGKLYIDWIDSSYLEIENEIGTNSSLISNITGRITSAFIKDEPFRVYATFTSVRNTSDANVSMGYYFNLTGENISLTQTATSDLKREFAAPALFYSANYTQNATITLRTYFVNSTFNITLNNTINFAIAPINITNCTGGSPILNFSFYAQNALTTATNTNMDATFTANYLNTLYQNFSFNFTNKTTFSVCSNLPNNLTINSIQSFTGGDGTYRNLFYYLVNATVVPGSPSMINLYNLKTAGSVATQISVLTGNAQGVPNAYVQTIRYYPATNQYLLVSMLKTDNNGVGSTYLVPITEIYRFVVVSSEGQLLYTSDTAPLSCDPGNTLCTKTLLIDANTPNEYTGYVGAVGVGCTYTNATGTILCSSNNPSGTATALSLEVREVQAFSNPIICTNTLSAGSGSVQCNGLNNVSTYAYLAVANIQAGEVIIAQGLITPTQSPKMGNSGLFFGMVLVVGLGLMGVYAGIVGVLFASALGFGLATFIGFLPFAVGTVASVFMFAIIIAWAIVGRRS